MLGLVVCLALLVPATAACLYYLVPTLLGVLRGTHVPRLAESTSDRTFAVLIPAYNEESTLPAALRSLASQDYPADRFRVFVVADNCTDGTAQVARSFGATCLVRTDAERRGKGFALAFGIERVLKNAPDVVLVLDADCELNPGALRALDAAFAAGADAVQTAVRYGNPDAGPAGYVAAVGAAVDRAVAAGRDRLGLSVPLRGMGMAFRRAVLARVPWDAFGIAEDAEYDRRLRAAGVQVRFCGGAVVTSSAPDQLDDLCRQRRRWRVALRFGSWAGSKPLVLLQLAAAVAAGLAAGFVAWPVMLVALTAAVYARAAWEVGVTRRRVGLLLRTPGVVLRLGWLAAAGWVRPDPSAWVRTRRPGERNERAACPPTTPVSRGT